MGLALPVPTVPNLVWLYDTGPERNEVKVQSVTDKDEAAGRVPAPLRPGGLRGPPRPSCGAQEPVPCGGREMPLTRQPLSVLAERPVARELSLTLAPVLGQSRGYFPAFGFFCFTIMTPTGLGAEMI